MSNVNRKDLNIMGTFIQQADLKSVKLAGAEALAKSIPAQTVEQQSVASPAMAAGVPPVQPVDSSPVMGVNPPVGDATTFQPVAQTMEPIGQQTVAAPPAMPEIPGAQPEIYNPIPNGVGGAPILDDVQKKIETPMEFNQKPASSIDNIVQFPGVTAEATTSTPAVEGNMFDMPVSTPDAKVEPLPGTTNEDKVRDLKDKLIENIGNLIEEYVNSVQELTGDKKVVDSAMSGLDKVQTAVSQGSQILAGQSYQPIDMTQDEVIRRAA